MKAAIKTSLAQLPKSFDGLVRFHAPRPIHDTAGYDNAVEIVDALAGHRLNEDQEDYLLVLSTLVERYEADTLPSPRRVSGRSMLRYVLDENNLGGDDLAMILGVDRSVAYRILKGERGLTTAHLRSLRERFGVSADVFV